MSRNRRELQQVRKERTLRESMQTEIQQQPNSEKTNRRRNERTERIIMRVRRKHTPHKRKKENRRNEQTLHRECENQRSNERIHN